MQDANPWLAAETVWPGYSLLTKVNAVLEEGLVDR